MNELRQTAFLDFPKLIAEVCFWEVTARALEANHVMRHLKKLNQYRSISH